MFNKIKTYARLFLASVKTKGGIEFHYEITDTHIHLVLDIPRGKAAADAVNDVLAAVKKIEVASKKSA